MNWKVNFKNKLLLILSIGVLISISGFLIENSIENKINKKTLGLFSKNSEKINSIFFEISPDGKKQIDMYERPFDGNGELNSRNYLSNQYLFSVEEFSNGSKHEIFTASYKSGYPHWLGNDYIFFTEGCKTGCRGFYLVNTNSKQSSIGTITTEPVSENGFKTYFHDRLDHNFQFEGVSKNIRSSYLNGQAYLVFEMWNNDKYIGEKKFLFTKNYLKEL